MQRNKAHIKQKLGSERCEIKARAKKEEKENGNAREGEELLRKQEVGADR